MHNEYGALCQFISSGCFLSIAVRNVFSAALSLQLSSREQGLHYLFEKNGV